MSYSFLHISEAVAIAFHTMGVLLSQQDKCIRAHDIASQLQISEHHLQKIHQKLVKAGLIKSTRGPNGGVMLNRDSDKITLFDVFQAIEGPIELQQCMLGRPQCSVEDCVLGDIVHKTNQLALQHLQKNNVAKLANQEWAHAKSE